MYVGNQTFVQSYDTLLKTLLKKEIELTRSELFAGGRQAEVVGQPCGENVSLPPLHRPPVQRTTPATHSSTAATATPSTTW